MLLCAIIFKKNTGVNEMRAKVHDDLCIGCGLCASICPQVFLMDEEKATVIANTSVDTYDEVQEAIVSCPVAAISDE